jgi:hypothetical protein
MIGEFGRRPVGIIEIDQEICPLTYGVGDCGAVLDDPGSRQIAPNANISRKCFNTLGTCQDVESYLDFARDPYDPSINTLRFVEDISGVPDSLQAIPSILSISQTATRINPGGIDKSVSSLGSRAVLTVSFRDHPSSDIGIDPYLDERDYIASDRGTYWGKWLYRNSYRQGLPVRYRVGYIAGDSFVEQTVYNYFLQRVDGPTADGVVTLQAFDLIKFLEASNAVFPSPSPGVLSSDMNTSATSFVLSPSGVGDDYPASFRCRIGGEGFDVTRSGDTCTVVDRGIYSVQPASHREGDAVQVVAEMSGLVHDVAYEIITSAVPLMADYINKSQWDGVAIQSLPRIYSADITEPTGVEELLQELSESSPAYWWVDIRTNRLMMGAIRPPVTVPPLLDEQSAFLGGSIAKAESPAERVDEVWVYYFIRNAAGSITDQSNYSRRYILVNPFEQQRQGRRSIKRVLTRWVVGLDAAEELAQSYISRFQETPIKLAFDCDASQAELWVGSVVRPQVRILQDDTGDFDVRDFQIVEAIESVTGSQLTFSAQSYGFFSPVDPDFLRITIVPENTEDSLGRAEMINLRDLYDATVGVEVPNIEVVILGGPNITAGTLIGGSIENSDPASFEIPDDWPWSPSIKVIVEEGGAIVGRGGKGGSTSGGNGSPGQTGLLCRYNIEMINLGIIAGGGGGGGGVTSPSSGLSVDGGGGAGREPGFYGSHPVPRTPFGASSGRIEPGWFRPGTGGFASNFDGEVYGGWGGDLGEDGFDGFSTDGGTEGLGGAAGVAVDGDSYITWLFEGEIYGARVN